MKHRNGPWKIQPLTVPIGRRSFRVDVDAVSLETGGGRGECGVGPSGCGGGGDKRPAARMGEPHGAVFLQLDREALFVHRAMVPPTE